MLDTFTYFFSYSINPDTIPEKVERNAFINSLPPKYSYKESLVPEADSDGNIDFKEATVAVGAAKYDEFGNLIFETLYDACNISDITAKGYEQFMEKKNISDSVIASNIQITPFSDKILYADNDNDGLANKDDPYPDTPFDDRFEIVSDYNYIPKVDFVERHYNYGLYCYGRDSEDEIIKNSIAWLTFLGIDFVAFIPSSIYIFEHNNVNSAEFSDVYEHFSYFLSRYLTASGHVVELTKKEMKDIIYSQNNNIEHLSYNVNAIKECAEQVLLNNNSEERLVISSTSENNFIVACYDSINCNHSNGYYNTDALDWGYAVGEAL